MERLSKFKRGKEIARRENGDGTEEALGNFAGLIYEDWRYAAADETLCLTPLTHLRRLYL